MTTVYRDVKIGVAAPLDELYLLDVDAMVLTLYEDGIVQRQVRVVRLRGTRRVGTFKDISADITEKNVLVEDVEIWTRKPVEYRDGRPPSCEGQTWERIGKETRKIPVDKIKQQLYAAFDAANVIGI